MASEILKLTAQIIISHASMTELTPKELVGEIKQIYEVLASLEKEAAVPEAVPPPARLRKPRKVKMLESPEARAVEDEDKAPLGDPDYMEFMESREG
jgi:predicted transcriptional regulator